MGRNNGVIQSFLAEGLVALLPEYGEEGGGTEVVTLQGAHQERRSLSWLVELLARYYRLNLAAVRRHTGRLLGLRHHIPLPLAEGLVLLPVKVRRAEVLGEHTAGYVNLLQVERVDAVEERAGRQGTSRAGVEQVHPPDAPIMDQIHFGTEDPALTRCRIICRSGLVIFCLNTAATVRAKLHQGEAARQELLQRQKVTALPAAPFQGLDGAALQELLPSCDCLLRSMLLFLLEKVAQPELDPEQREPAATASERTR